MTETPAIEMNKDARTWATVCHLSALVTFLGIPLGNILGPLVVWLLKRNDHSFVDDQGKEALNFQISMSIYGLLVGMLLWLLVLGSIPFHTVPHPEMWDLAPLVLAVFAIAAMSFLALFFADLVLVIVAAVKASNGEDYRYPITIRLVK